MENTGVHLTLKTSAQINEIVAALAKTQGQLKPAAFNRVNPHYKNKYADFTSCMDAVREPLSNNGLAISQMPSTTADGKFILITLLAHVSGQWMAGEFPLISAKMDSQGIGSAMTYAKRYSLCGMIGIVADEDADADDDGETACGRGNGSKPTQTQQTQQNVNAKVGKTEVVALNGLIQSLDEESNRSFLSWVKKEFNANSLQEIPAAAFERCMASLNAKIKYMNDKNKQQTMAVA